MSINLCVETLNTTLQAIARQVELFAGVALKAAVDLRGSLESLTGDYRWENGPIAFSDLQATLLKVLLVLLLGTCVLIGYSWSVYGQVITEKFVRPSTLKEIEELKLSVAKLKLPKEHSPRI
ncbi:uncharacterized protein Dana_GF12798 [Drosophila ananassae]|uniref:Uncharacterized protein n=1 Tax=Drosophila ananassae TaxID=7217 RepID=B3MBU3_DROAN|nr:uncharacterized protein LOC6495644 [Drosophila ananassae]EDV36114.1 uncharacterized protein Dana_GF12798 [Drosophila ananassae]